MPFDPPFSGYIQPPGVPPDPTGDCWRGPPGPMGPPGPPGAMDAAPMDGFAYGLVNASWNRVVPTTQLGMAVGQVPVFSNRGGNPSYELNGQWIINQAAPTGTHGADIFIRRDGTSVNTGTSANINGMMNMTMAVGANDPTSNWGLVVHPSTSQTTGGQTLAAFLATDRLPGSNAHIWGALINVTCQTGLASSVVGQATLGQENDFASSLADDAVNPAKWGGIGNRHLVHYIVTRFAGATQNEVTTGLWFGTTNSYIDSVIGFDVGSGGGCCVRQVVDTRGAIPPTGVTDPVASVRMLAGQIVDFNGGPALNSAAGNYLQYTTSGTPRLRYMVGGTEVWSITDAGVGTGAFIPLGQRATANGVATLDATGKVPTIQLPGSVSGTLTYRGGWNASTNTPALASGALAGGVAVPAANYYVVTVGATTAAIDGITTWVAGDWALSDGSVWQRVQNSTSPYLPLSGGAVSGPTSFGSTVSIAGTVSGAGITTLLSPYALTSSVPLASSTVPVMDGTAAVGAGTTWARADHVHPVDDSRYAATNPAGYQTAAQVNASITASAYALPTASTTVLGGVKVDGTTVTIAGGVISSTATGGGGPAPSTTPPLMDGVAAIGTGTTYARADHVHASDTSRLPTVYTATGGTSLRSAQDRAADWINILDLGAIGDGVTDDTAAFVAASGKPSGTTIFLPANKTFLITAQSYTFSNRCVSLIGGDRHSTIIRLKPSSPAMTAGLFFWNGPNRPGPAISNFTLDVNSNSASAYGQSLIGISVPTSRPEISNVSVINMGSLCLAFGGTSWATGGEIRNCYVQQLVGDQVNQSKAISLSIFSTIPNVGVRILNNTFVNTNVLLTGTQKCLIEGNEISGWGVGAGVAMGWNVADTVSSFDNTVVNNKCHDSQPGRDQFGVTPNGLELWTDRGVIAGNHCWNNSGAGLLVGGKNGLIVGNIAYDNNVFNAAGQAGMVALYASATHNASFTTWIGNKSYDSGVGRQQYGFGTAGGVVSVTLTSNDFSGTTGQTNLAGANPVVNPFLDALFGRQMVASTGDIQGNIYIPFCNGVPTGIPAWSAAGIALKYDIANHKLWAYDNSLNSWQGFDSTPAPDQLVLYRSGIAAGNGADTTLDVLQSYTLPANTLAAVGDILHIVAGGTLAASTDNKQIRVYFGSAVAMQVSATAAGTTQWACEVWITKTGPSTQSSVTLANVFSNFTNGTGGGTSSINDTLPQVIQVTGQNNTNPVAGSIVCQFLSVELLR